MAAGEAAGVVQAPLGIVGADVVAVPLPQLFDGILNGPGTNGRFLPSEAGPGRSGSARARRYSRQAAFFPHLLGAEVCVAASTVPVPGDGFGVKRGDDAKVFTHAVQEEARHPQVVAHADPLTRANLELPLQHRCTVTRGRFRRYKRAHTRRRGYLGRHHFGVGAADLDPGVQTGPVVRLHHVSAVSLVGAHAAVVRS